MNQSVLGLTDSFKKFFDKVGLLDLRYFFFSRISQSSSFVTNLEFFLIFEGVEMIG